MESYVTVLADMENAATLPVFMHSASTMSEGPSDPRGLKVAMLFYNSDVSASVQARLCACCSVCLVVCIHMVWWIRLFKMFWPCTTWIRHSFVCHRLCTDPFFTLCVFQSELNKVMWPKSGHVTNQWQLSGQPVAFVSNNYPVTKCWVKVVSLFVGASYFAVGWEASQKVNTNQSSLAPYLSSCRSLLASIRDGHPDMNYRESSPPSSPPLSSHVLAILTLKTTPRRTSVSLRIECAVNSSLFLPSG